jgi:hypothetical protein
MTKLRIAGLWLLIADRQTDRETGAEKLKDEVFNANVPKKGVIISSLLR